MRGAEALLLLFWARLQAPVSNFTVGQGVRRHSGGSRDGDRIASVLSALARWRGRTGGSTVAAGPCRVDVAGRRPSSATPFVPAVFEACSSSIRLLSTLLFRTYTLRIHNPSLPSAQLSLRPYSCTSPRRPSSATLRLRPSPAARALSTHRRPAPATARPPALSLDSTSLRLSTLADTSHPQP